MWSDNAPPESCLLVVVCNSTQAAVLAERWKGKSVAVLLPVEEPERSEADLARITSVGAKVVAFVPTRSLQVQDYLGASGYEFLDWTSELAELVTLPEGPQTGPLGASEALAALPLLNRAEIHELKLSEVDEAFNSFRQLQRVAREEYGDDPEESFVRFLESTGDAFFRLCATLEEQSLCEAKERIVHAHSELNVRGKHWGERLRAESLGCVYRLTALADQLTANNPKGNAIRELAKGQAETDVICPLERLEGIQNQFPGARATILAGVGEHTESVLVPSWLGEKRMLRFFFPPSARRTHFIFYPWEARALRRRMRERERLVAAHGASPLVPHLSSTQVPPNARPSHPSALILNEEAEETFESWIREARIQRALSVAVQSSPDESLTETRLHLLSDGYFVYYTPTHSVIRVEGLDTREVDEGQGVHQISADELDVGDLIVESLGTARDLIREWADQELPKGCRDLARTWHGPLQVLRSGLKSDQDVCRKLQAAGCKRHPATVRGWLHSTHLIGPNDGEDLDIIAKVTGNDVLSNKLDDVFEAIRIVRNAHLRAATKLQEHLESKIAQQLSSGDGLQESVLLEDNLLLLRVEEIRSTTSRVSHSIANRVRES